MTVIGSTRNSRINKFILAFTIVVCAGGFLFGQIFTPAQASVVKPSTKSVLTARTVARTSSKSKLSNRAAKIPLLQSKPKPKRPQPNYERLRITIPKPDEAIQNTFTVSGYAWRWFEGNIPTKIYDYNNTLLYDGYITASPVSYSSPTYFSKTITLSKQPTTDAGTIEFNEYSAKNGRVVYQKAVPVRFASFVGKPVITLLSPNSGEVYQGGSITKGGSIIKIKWQITGVIPYDWDKNSRGIPDVRIGLYQGDNFVKYIFPRHSGGPPAYWSLPEVSATEAGNNYRIKVMALGVPDLADRYFDFSDEPFSIIVPFQTVYNAVPTELMLGQSYNFSIQITKAWPNTSILFYLQRADGTMQFNGVDIFSVASVLGKSVFGARPWLTDQNGNWSYSDSWQLAPTGQNGVWTSWVSVGGIVSNKVSHSVLPVNLSLKFISPKEGEQWPIGSTQVVRWSRVGSLPLGARTAIRFSPTFGGKWLTFYVSSPNSAETSFNWAIPSTFLPGNYFLAVFAYIVNSDKTTFRTFGIDYTAVSIISGDFVSSTSPPTSPK